jgi:S-adenosylmethionine:tRNA ribosyltransferase-isomerase
MQAGLQLKTLKRGNNMAGIEDINYVLPEELISAEPSQKRDECRLLMVSREQKSFEDRIFHDIIDAIHPGDCLVMNDTKVFKARLFGLTLQQKKVELLLVEKEDDHLWKALLKNSKKFPEGTSVRFNDLEAEIQGKDGEMRYIRFTEALTYEKINRIGFVPLPPYIIKKRKKLQSKEYNPDDDAYYQSILAKYYGSVAAPTASLHFTQDLLRKLQDKNITLATITLHVGPGTFKPIDTDSIDSFQIHQEWLEVSEKTIRDLIETRKNKGRIIAVGTTVVRALESMARGKAGADDWAPYSGMTRLFIKGEYHFNVVDAMITNFHMPKSTLLLLVYSFGGMELIKKAYRHALDHKYRFLSYGDAMMIV